MGRSTGLAVCFLTAALSAQSTSPISEPLPLPKYAANSGRIYWRPVQPDQLGGFTGAVAELAQTLERDQYLTDRGVIHSANFQYGNFRYEKNFFEVYKGILLRSFLDGRMDLGIFNHRQNRQYFNPRGFGPARNNRYELLLRLNIQ